MTFEADEIKLTKLLENGVFIYIFTEFFKYLIKQL